MVRGWGRMGADGEGMGADGEGDGAGRGRRVRGWGGWWGGG